MLYTQINKNVLVASFSRVAQRKRAGPITQRSVDRNHPLLRKTFSTTISRKCNDNVISSRNQPCSGFLRVMGAPGQGFCQRPVTLVVSAEIDIFASQGGSISEPRASKPRILPLDHLSISGRGGRVVKAMDC